jgi:phosphatidylserine/phosphatidylglycerophosphate/cardiolipin synthase-like enzyme
LPAPIRFVGPWHEAQSRIVGRPAGALARLNNRFWIGQPVLPFAGEV